MAEQAEQSNVRVHTSSLDYLNAQLNQAGLLLTQATKNAGGVHTLSFGGSIDMAAVHAELAKAGAIVAVSERLDSIHRALEALLVSQEPQEPANPAQDL